MDKGRRNYTSGLRNLGNTCYLNSVIQCLAHSPSVMNYLTDKEFDEDLQLDRGAGQIGAEFRTLLIQLWIKNGIVDPRAFRQHSDTGMMNRDSGHIIGWQNDAHEFLEFLLDSLHKGLQYRPKISISVKTAEDKLNETDRMAIEAYERWRGDFKEGYSNIVELFYGQFLSEVRKGEEVSRCFDPYQVLSLPIPDKPIDSGLDGQGGQSEGQTSRSEIHLTDCLDAFMATEKLNENTERRFYFWRTPQNLVISLKRFRNDGSKDQRRVVYTDTLDLSRYSKGYKREGIHYGLYGICCHQGGGGQHGHYISLCRKRGSPQWFRHDDEGVDALGNGGALPLTSSAYIFFYHRLD